MMFYATSTFVGYLMKNSVNIKVRKVGDLSQGWPKCSLFNSYNKMQGGATPFLGLTHFTLDPYFIMLSVKQGGIKYHFWVFGMIRSGIEPWSPKAIVEHSNHYAKREPSGSLSTMVANSVYIDICNFFVQKEKKKVNISKWMGLQMNLYPLRNYLFLTEHFQPVTFEGWRKLEVRNTGIIFKGYKSLCVPIHFEIYIWFVSE